MTTHTNCGRITNLSTAPLTEKVSQYHICTAALWSSAALSLEIQFQCWGNVQGYWGHIPLKCSTCTCRALDRLSMSYWHWLSKYFESQSGAAVQRLMAFFNFAPRMRMGLLEIAFDSHRFRLCRSTSCLTFMIHAASLSITSPEILESYLIIQRQASYGPRGLRGMWRPILIDCRSLMDIPAEFVIILNFLCLPDFVDDECQLETIVSDLLYIARIKCVTTS